MSETLIFSLGTTSEVPDIGLTAHSLTTSGIERCAIQQSGAPRQLGFKIGYEDCGERDLCLRLGENQ